MKLLVISIDAIDSQEFIENLHNLKNLNKLVEAGTLVTDVLSVYPSLTYPCHGTIVTGELPETHGIISNTIFSPWKKFTPWRWTYDGFKVPTIFDSLKEHGYKVGTIFWPTMGKSKMDYVFPEIWGKNNFTSFFKILSNGTFSYIVKALIKDRKNLKAEPKYLDDFMQNMALRTIKENKVDAMFIHFLDLDLVKHKRGVNNQYTKEALQDIDQRIGELLDAVGTKCNIVVLGDHSHFDVSKQINLNHRLKEEFPVESKIDHEYKVLAHQEDGCAFIYVQDENIDIDELGDFLLTLEGVNKVAKTEKMPYKLIVEAKKGYYFFEKPKEYQSQHGYDPSNQNYQTIFLTRGKNVKVGHKIEGGSIINDGPSILKLLDIEFKCKGKVIEDMFNE